MKKYIVISGYLYELTTQQYHQKFERTTDEFCIFVTSKCLCIGKAEIYIEG